MNNVQKKWSSHLDPREKETRHEINIKQETIPVGCIPTTRLSSDRVAKKDEQ